MNKPTFALYRPLSNNPYGTHPSVTFKRLPFYDHLGDLLRPTTVMTRNPPRCIEDKGVKKQISEAYFVFNLTAGQAQVSSTLIFLPSHL